MAYSTIADAFLKKVNLPEKRSDAALQNYLHGDSRAWAHDKFERSKLLREIVTRPCSSYQTGEISASKNDYVKKISELQKQLGDMHELYKKANKKIEELERGALENRKSQIQVKDSEAKIVEQENIISELKNGNSDNFKNLLRERDALAEQLKNVEDLEAIRKKLKARADEADQMELEIAALKRELNSCRNTGGSGDKLKIDSELACQNCQSYIDELSRLKKTVELEEKRSTECMAERNFLRQKSRAIDLLEAELILFKNKYDEGECKIRALKEIICKNELAAKSSRESRCKLQDTEYKLHEAECESECLIQIIERLNANLNERDVYIDSLTKRLNEECSVEIYDGAPKKAISYESIASGTVESIVKKISNASAEASKCKCNVSNCKCAGIPGSSSVVSKSSYCKHYMKKLNKSLSKCKINTLEVTKSKIDAMQIDKLLDEVRLLRQQNFELDKELTKVKNDLKKMMEVVQEVEKERKSNETLEGELQEIRSNFEDNLSQINSKYESKIDELNNIEERLKNEMEKARGLEEKVCEACNELSHLKEFREKCENLQKSLNCVRNDHYERSRAVELIKKDCDEYLKENQELKCQVDKLKNELEQMCLKHCENSASQKEVIKKSVVEFKRHYDEKLQMIKCYEEKIKHLEGENETLKCAFMAKPVENCGCNDLLKKAAKFSLASLENEELVELHERITRAIKPRGQIHPQYSKIFDEICDQYNITDEMPVRDDIDEICSNQTFPKFHSRAPRNYRLKLKRSKSSILCKNFSKKPTTK